MFSIYRFTNTVNGKIYIGKTTRPKTRLLEHLSDAKKKSTHLIHSAIRKYGEEAILFEVIFTVFREEDLNHFEQLFIKEYDCCVLDGDGKGYNMTRGGDGFSSETARRYAGWNNPEWINPFSGEKGSRMSSMQNLRRVQDGTNPWAGEKGSKHSKEVCKQQLAEGRHPFQGEKGSEHGRRMVQKQLAEGTHTNLKTFTCPHCQKVGVGRNMFRWHFNHCKKKPS
jgi:group I intron endonuclease